MNTLLMLAPTQAPERALPDLDPAVLDRVGDEVLLASAATAKPAKVKSGTAPRTTTGVMFSSRAWSAGGNVD